MKFDCYKLKLSVSKNWQLFSNFNTHQFWSQKQLKTNWAHFFEHKERPQCANIWQSLAKDLFIDPWSGYGQYSNSTVYNITLYGSAAGCRSIQEMCALWKHGLTSKNTQKSVDIFLQTHEQILSTKHSPAEVVWSAAGCRSIQKMWGKYTSCPRYWNVLVLMNTGTFLVYQYCLKMWYMY